ncbi:MAG: apolipoprotein N-acyltransferase [Pseudomonadota bacterium]|nr:apolipoprotein N-acyltransferase [Pseudomonadota bacterium]MED5346849.1 apolipoprotein N-acyltransferase [Pseudomonadota bacterium]
MLTTEWRNGLLALLLGAVFPLGFAPLGWWPVSLLSAAGLFLILNSAQGGLLQLAWFYGLGKYLSGASWIYVSINEYGNASPLLAAVLVLLFVATLAVFMLPVGWSLRRFRVATPWVNGLIFCVAWVVAEWLLTWVLTGFPWLFIGYSLTDSPFVGLLPVVGALGTSFLALLGTVGATLCLRAAWRSLPMPKAALVMTGAPIALVLAFLPWQWVTPLGQYSAAIVQGNVDQAIKWDADQRSVIVNRYLSLSEPHWSADTLVWPEFALTAYGAEAERVTAALHTRAQASDTNVVIGAPRVEWSAAAKEDEPRYRMFNAAIGLGLANGLVTKHHLVPFGDYVPLQDWLRGLIEFFDLPMSNASRGAARQSNVVLTLGGNSAEAAIGICYEIAYGQSMRQRAQNAGVLMTLTNDTWFGRSIGPHQHMQIARVRAIENGRWLLRAANDGVTGVVDHQGRLRGQLPQFTQGVLVTEYQIMQGTTPYSALGDWPLFVMLLALCVGLGYRMGITGVA